MDIVSFLIYQFIIIVIVFKSKREYMHAVVDYADSEIVK
jgi:hypothetical protein